MKYFLSVILLFLGNTLLSQNVLNGTVIDTETNQPLPFANIYDNLVHETLQGHIF